MSPQEREAAKRRKFQRELVAYMRDRLSKGDVAPHVAELFRRRIPILEAESA